MGRGQNQISNFLYEPRHRRPVLEHNNTYDKRLVRVRASLEEGQLRPLLGFLSTEKVQTQARAPESIDLDTTVDKAIDLVLKTRTPAEDYSVGGMRAAREQDQLLAAELLARGGFHSGKDSLKKLAQYYVQRDFEAQGVLFKAVSGRLQALIADTPLYAQENPVVAKARRGKVWHQLQKGRMSTVCGKTYLTPTQGRSYNHLGWREVNTGQVSSNCQLCLKNTKQRELRTHPEAANDQYRRLLDKTEKLLLASLAEKFHTHSAWNLDPQQIPDFVLSVLWREFAESTSSEWVMQGKSTFEQREKLANYQGGQVPDGMPELAI